LSLEKILGDTKEVLKIIVKEVNELKSKYGIIEEQMC